MPSHGHGWEFGDDANAGVFVRLQTESALSVHSNAHTLVVCRTVLM